VRWVYHNFYILFVFVSVLVSLCVSVCVCVCLCARARIIVTYRTMKFYSYNTSVEDVRVRKKEKFTIKQ